ncbi:MAG: LysM peptidoglycan-binding domain-containing protein [Verrucomicrobiota bacterium]
MNWTRRDFLSSAYIIIGGYCLDLEASNLYAATEKLRTYTVRKGDSLSSIARKYKCSVSLLKSANGLKQDTILIGQKLEIPSPSNQKSHKVVKKTYTVKKGDTISTIARKMNSHISAIRSENKLRNDLIYIGQKIVVPIQPVSSKRESSRSFVFLNKAIGGRIKVANLNRKRWKYIVAHHSGTPVGSGAIFDAYHRSRGMENGLAYHFVIGNGSDSGDGQIEISERWRKQIHGGHVKSNWYNQNSIGICLVGNFQKKKPSRNQVASFIELTNYLRSDLLGGKPKLMLHREIKNERTICPGKYFPAQAMHKLFG